MAMAAHRSAAVQIDRTGWTDQQWIEDADRLMGDLHGSVSSLLNGHVTALLRVSARDATNEHRIREEIAQAIERVPLYHITERTGHGGMVHVPRIPEAVQADAAAIARGAIS